MLFSPRVMSQYPKMNGYMAFLEMKMKMCLQISSQACPLASAQQSLSTESHMILRAVVQLRAPWGLGGGKERGSAAYQEKAKARKRKQIIHLAFLC